jgi:hypothetical protein
VHKENGKQIGSILPGDLALTEQYTDGTPSAATNQRKRWPCWLQDEEPTSSRESTCVLPCYQPENKSNTKVHFCFGGSTQSFNQGASIVYSQVKQSMPRARLLMIPSLRHVFLTPCWPRECSFSLFPTKPHFLLYAIFVFVCFTYILAYSTASCPPPVSLRPQ